MRMIAIAYKRERKARKEETNRVKAGKRDKKECIIDIWYTRRRVAGKIRTESYDVVSRKSKENDKIRMKKKKGNEGVDGSRVRTDANIRPKKERTKHLPVYFATTPEQATTTWQTF
jgi:hypothetical protein